MISKQTTIRVANKLLPTIARFTLTATLFMFFWRSAMTKFGDGLTGLWTPSLDAYVQVLPWRMEAVGYDPDALTFVDNAIVIAGMWGEVILPILIAIGLFTRLAASGMIVFVIVMSLVDFFGHGVAPGAWFDGAPDSVLFDQRMFWINVLMVPALMGGGLLSIDQLIRRRK